MNTLPQIVFEDNHLIVAVKQPGVLSQADGSDSPDMLTLLKQDIKIRYNKPGEVFLGLVHRLDQPVGGLMVFARTSKAASRLSQQVRDHQFAKIYLAVVQGRPIHDRGTLQDNLLQDAATRQVRVVQAGSGQTASLDYYVISQRPEINLALLAIHLHTGRGHQIRVQLASRGWPVVNDYRYGSGAKNDRKADIALMAAGLGFSHPISRQWMQFSSCPPQNEPWTAFPAVDYSDVFKYFTKPL